MATRNRHKIEELACFLKGSGWEIIPMESVGVAVPEEAGETLRENALHKAATGALLANEWALADDTGLFVEALGGRPGVFSARYAGEGAADSDNVQRLLKELEGVPEEKRGAFFSCVLALAHQDGREVTVEGRLEGVIAREPRGKNGFGYDPVFFLPERGLTLAELSPEEKNKISHRGRALFKMRGVLGGIIELENSKL